VAKLGLYPYYYLLLGLVFDFFKPIQEPGSLKKDLKFTEILFLVIHSLLIYKKILKR